MNASYYISSRGNMAIQAECWIIDIAAAKQACKLLDCRPGTYWQNHIGRATRSASRAKLDTVRVNTAGYSTSDLYNVLRSFDCTVTERDSY